MKTLVLSSTEIENLLDLDDLRLQMQTALKNVSSESVQNETRNVVDIHNGNALGFMPALSQEKGILGYKAVSVFPKNKIHGLNPHQGLVTLLCAETGRPIALLEGSSLTAIRTAAVSAVATNALARGDSRVLSVLGAGTQAYEHIRALLRVRTFDKIKIFARDPIKLSRIKSQFSSLVEIQSSISAEAAVLNSDVIVTCTSSAEPIIDSMTFPPGVHVNAVGSCRPGQQEIGLRFHPALRIFLDHGPSCLKEADEIFRPHFKDDVYCQIVGELGEVLNENKKGREFDSDITFFKSVGLAAEDLFAADLFYQKAVQNKVGTYVQF